MRQILRLGSVKSVWRLSTSSLILERSVLRSACTCLQRCYSTSSKDPQSGRKQTGSWGSNVQQQMGGKKGASAHYRPGWMVSMHRALMDSVEVPPVRHGSVYYSEELLEDMSTSDLMSQARAIKKVDKYSMKLIQALWRRFDTMTVEEMLTTADIFFMNNVHTPYYTSALLSYVSEMFDLLPMTPSQVTRLSFHMITLRFAPVFLIDSIEKHLCERLDEFHMDQVCIVCQAFFLSKKKITSVELLDKISVKLISEFDTVHRWFVPMLLKSLRYSNFMKMSFYKNLGHLIVKSDLFFGSRTLNNVSHFAFAYASLRVTHDELFTYILQMCVDHLKKTKRLKDLTKVIWACGTLMNDNDRHLALIQELISSGPFSDELILQYPDNLAECLLGLCFLNIYPEKLLNKLFDPEVIQVLLGFGEDRTKSMQLIFLDQSISIECPHYTGHRLTQADKLVAEQQLEHYFSVEVDMSLRKSIKPVLSALSQALGEDKVACTNVLPHFKLADFLLVFDQERQEFVSFPDNYIVTDLSSHSRQDNNLQRIVVVLISMAQKSHDGRLLGTMQCKLRQLAALGYQVVIVPPKEGLEFMMMDQAAIQKALLQRIYSLVDL